MQMNGDGFGMDGQASLVIIISKTNIRFHREVRLALEIVFPLCGIGCLLHDRTGFLALDGFLLKVDVGRSGVDLDGVRCHGFRGAHVGGQHFQLHFHFFRGIFGVGFGIRAHNRQHVAILEDFGVVEDRTIPAITFVRREGDQAGNAVLAFYVFMGDHFENAGHFLRFRSVNLLDVGM